MKGFGGALKGGGGGLALTNYSFWVLSLERTGSRGSNLDTTKVYSAPIVSATPTMPVATSFSVNTCHTRGKKRGLVVKILAAPSVRLNIDIRATNGRKGVKIFYIFIII